MSRMRWSVRPVRRAGKIRPASAADPFIQTPFLPAPFLQAVRSRLAFAGAGRGVPGRIQGPVQGSVQRPVSGGLPSLLFALRKSPKPGSGAQPGRGGEGEKSAANAPDSAQPSLGAGVSKSMATLVLDNAALGAALDLQPELRQSAGLGARAELDPESDAALMLRLAAGEEACFTILAEKYHRAMIHFLFRMVHNQAIAEELAQEVFLRVYRSRESYRAEAKFSTWLYRIATNLAVNYARDTRRERGAQTVYLDAPDEETGATPEVADVRPNGEQQLVRDERLAAIRAQVMALPERQRAAVLMHKYQGLDYREIGEVLKLSESATKSLLFRAYQTLREKLKNFVGMEN